jgi:hypothetical protein
MKNPFYKMMIKNRVRFIEGDGDGQGGGSGNDGGNGGDWTPPEGFDPDDFDAETHAPVLGKIKSKRDAIIAERDEYKKKSEELRKVVSTKDGPGSVEEYSKNFKPDDKYAPILNDAENDKGKFLSATLSDFDKIAHEKKLTIEQANAIKSEMFKLLENTGAIDVRTDEEKQKFIAEKQKEVLGDKAQEIVERNLGFVKDYNVFSDDEKNLLSLAIKEGNPLIVSVVDKIRVLFGRGDSSDIPAKTNADGLPPDAELKAKYNDPKTTPEERHEIIKRRFDAGRTGKFE